MGVHQKSEAVKKAKQKWDKANLTVITVRLANARDAEIIKAFKAAKNKTEFVRQAFALMLKK